MIVPIDPKTVLEFVNAGKTWLAEALARSKRTEAQRGARLLHTTGTLLAALHTLDNALRVTFGELNLFDPSWSATRREQLMSRVNDLANQEYILPVLRQYSTDLKQLLHETPGEQEREIGHQILYEVRGILAALGDSTVTPFRNGAALRDFLAGIRQAKSSQEITGLVEQAESLLQFVERDTIAAADRAFARLKSLILKCHNELPDPGWVASSRLTSA